MEQTQIAPAVGSDAGLAGGDSLVWRELNAAVADRIFGRSGPQPWTLPVEQYSNTGDGMLQVLAKMKSLGWIYIIQDDQPGESCLFWKVSRADPKENLESEVTAATLPEAVCRAALDAIKQEPANEKALPQGGK